MRKLFLIMAFIFYLPDVGYSQILRQPVSADNITLGSYSTKQYNVFSYLNNQAALAQMKYTSAGVYGERRFLLAATSLYSASFAIPTKNGNFGFNIMYSGFKNFNENQIGLAYARSLGKKVDVGIQFNYYGYSVPSYTSAATVNFEIGAIIHLTEQLNMGLHVYNPVGGKFTKTDEKITTAYTIGLGYDVSDNFFISTEIVKEENFPVNINVGIQYQFMSQFYAKAGIASATSAAYAGLGIAWNYFRLDVTASYHPQLGFSPGLLLIMNFGTTAISFTHE